MALVSAASGRERSRTPEHLRKKVISPRVKSSPFDSPELPLETDGRMDAVLQRLRHITMQEVDLPRLFDFGEIYGVLGTSADSVASAVYSLFAELFKGHGTQSQFVAANAYRYYSKFPIESATTCLSSARYRVISDKLKVDPHFVRFPRVTFKGGVAASLQENVFMLAGSSNKKSTILKLWRKTFQPLMFAVVVELNVQGFRAKGFEFKKCIRIS